MKLSHKIKFATSGQAQKLLTQQDQFTDRWSRFDIDSRMGKAGHTKEDLFDFILKQVKEWQPEEQAIINLILVEIEELIQKEHIHLPLPEQVYLLKTTTQEEGGARGYTRQNYIVLNEEMFSGDREALRHLIIHELFHVITRNSGQLRKEIYKIIGVDLINDVEYPESLKKYGITNPDAPQTDHAIHLMIHDRPVTCMMILYATEAYHGSHFFKYLRSGFLELEGDQIKRAKIIDHKPVIYTLKEVSGFFEQVGRNTDYIIHPEEILAENFVAAMLGRDDLPDQYIVDQIKELLVK